MKDKFLKTITGHGSIFPDGIPFASLDKVWVVEELS